MGYKRFTKVKSMRKRLVINECFTLGDLVPYVQFKIRENNHGGVLLLLKLQAAVCDLLKALLLHGCFSRFLDCTNGTKSRNASHMQEGYRTR